MFTHNELESVQNALRNAEATIKVREMEAQQSFVGRLLFPNEKQRALNVAKEIVEVAIRQRNLFIEDPNARHEEALQLIEMLGKVSSQGWIEQAIKHPSVTEKLSDLGKKIVLPIINNPLTTTFGKYARWILIVAGLALAAYIINALSVFFPHRRRV